MDQESKSVQTRGLIIAKSRDYSVGGGVWQGKKQTGVTVQWAGRGGGGGHAVVKGYQLDMHTHAPWLLLSFHD